MLCPEMDRPTGLGLHAVRVNADDHIDAAVTILEPFWSPGVPCILDLYVYGCHRCPIDEICTLGNGKAISDRDPRMERVRDVVVPIAVLHDAGVAQNAGWVTRALVLPRCRPLRS